MYRIKLVTFLVILSGCFGIEFKLDDLFDFKLIKPGDFLMKIDKRDLFFHLYTSSYPFPREIDEDNVDIIENKYPIKVLIHGWGGNENIRAYNNITKEYFKNGHYNIIHVDWRNVAVLPYALATMYAQQVGKILSKLLMRIQVEKSVPLNDFHLIGISLGAHVAGLAGKIIKEETREKIGRITALDPAGPLYEIPPSKETSRLTKDDGKVVDVIHTDGGFVGVLKPTGTIDFYPNGGVRPQPGCPLIPEEVVDLFKLEKLADNFFCGHFKAVEYFIQSINKNDYFGVECTSWFDFKLGLCDRNDINVMGENLLTEKRGNFYLVTNNK